MNGSPTDKENKLVMSCLKTHGYHRVTAESNGQILIADGLIRKMVVIVRTSTNKVDDIKAIVEIARQKKREIWIAVVEPTENEIAWELLK